MSASSGVIPGGSGINAPRASSIAAMRPIQCKDAAAKSFGL
jgi:hypothetical protein